ncbi:hypothetical protein [uncultured Mediterranean phage uvMED]|nr:hypothetical protein [uncultured Mediterranean phage uvMED]BAR19758.1 hypothetical protein [uncultured Mediterranean phage uvMED]BAR19807.1 hypothetical protein [uncultured Mediterranean phage uvMED]
MKLSKGKMIETTVIKENDKLAIGSIYYTSDMDDNFSYNFCEATEIQSVKNFERLTEYMKRVQDGQKIFDCE